MTTLELVEKLRTLRLNPNVEAETQFEIEEAFGFLGGEFHREYRLSPQDRPDFFFRGTAIEVKVGKSSGSSIFRQIQRYALHDEVQEIILVTTKNQNFPDMVNGKKVYIVWIAESWL